MNYENGRHWNVFKYLTSSSDLEKQEMLMALFKIIEPEMKLSILNDERNPSIGDYNCLQNCIQNGDMQCFRSILIQYEENKENVDRLLKVHDQTYRTPLYLAISSNNDDIAIEILGRIMDETEAMNTLNRKTQKIQKQIYLILLNHPQSKLD